MISTKFTFLIQLEILSWSDEVEIGVIGVKLLDVTPQGVHRVVSSCPRRRHLFFLISADIGYSGDWRLGTGKRAVVQAMLPVKAQVATQSQLKLVILQFDTLVEYPSQTEQRLL